MPAIARYAPVCHNAGRPSTSPTRSNPNAPPRNAIGNGMSIGWIGWPLKWALLRMWVVPLPMKSVDFQFQTEPSPRPSPGVPGEGGGAGLLFALERLPPKEVVAGLPVAVAVEGKVAGI